MYIVDRNNRSVNRIIPLHVGSSYIMDAFDYHFSNNALCEARGMHARINSLLCLSNKIVTMIVELKENLCEFPGHDTHVQHCSMAMQSLPRHPSEDALCI